MPAVKLLEKLLDPSNAAFKERLLYIQKLQLDRMSALGHYEQMQDKALAKINEKVKRNGIEKGAWCYGIIVNWTKPFKRSFR